ncbi:MAG TPA: hypothetical protein VFC71_03835 [Candidatus Polarisedimenticolia bacterium]|nr:hypothetical protein [Candidatus Polarisedimenticolia bacterium]
MVERQPRRRLGHDRPKQEEAGANRLGLEAALVLVGDRAPDRIADQAEDQPGNEDEDGGANQGELRDPLPVARQDPRQDDRGDEDGRVQLRENTERDGGAGDPRASLERRQHGERAEQGGEEVKAPGERWRGDDRQDDEPDRDGAGAVGRPDALRNRPKRPHQCHEQGRLPAEEQPVVDLERWRPAGPDEIRHRHRDERKRRVLEREAAVRQVAVGKRLCVLEVEVDVELVREQLIGRRHNADEQDDERRQHQQLERRQGHPGARHRPSVRARRLPSAP